jgi:hypothetical protein
VKQKYRYGTTKYISFGERFHFHLKFLLIFIFLLMVGAGVLIYNIYTQNSAPQVPLSSATVKNITFDNEFFSTPYFRFTDSGRWKLIAAQSTANKFVFQKFLSNSNLVQHQLIVYINTTPPPLELAASRVLPVQLNGQDDAFIPMQVSDNCSKAYKPGELHKVGLRQIEGATLLCDPDQGQFRVVLAKAGGDYNLKLKRADGIHANYIIIYQNQKIDPDTDSVMQIAQSFQSL